MELAVPASPTTWITPLLTWVPSLIPFFAVWMSRVAHLYGIDVDSLATLPWSFLRILLRGSVFHRDLSMGWKATITMSCFSTFNIAYRMYERSYLKGAAALTMEMSVHILMWTNLGPNYLIVIQMVKHLRRDEFSALKRDLMFFLILSVTPDFVDVLLPMPVHLSLTDRILSVLDVLYSQ